MFYLGKCGARRIILGNRPISTVTRGPRHLQVARSTWQWKWLACWLKAARFEPFRAETTSPPAGGEVQHDAGLHGKAEPLQSGRCRGQGKAGFTWKAAGGLKLLSKFGLPILPLQLRNRKGKLGNLYEKIWLYIGVRRGWWSEKWKIESVCRESCGERLKVIEYVLFGCSVDQCK